ncbi:MAG: hypothetical protein VYC98_04690, partial [Planctomycetota bacterium]|nr:hypothetical protein [Planctomycetota bacterium]
MEKKYRCCDEPFGFRIDQGGTRNVHSYSKISLCVAYHDQIPTPPAILTEPLILQEIKAEWICADIWNQTDFKPYMSLKGSPALNRLEIGT